MLELMIAMALGLLIIAAATGVFLAGQRSLATQSGASDLQQNAIFGIAQLTHDLRHTNLNISSTTVITKNTKGAGVVFGDVNLSEKATITNISGDYITKAMPDDNPVFANIKNDQLTIQFKPHEAGLLQSCTGEPLSAGEVSVQRYFIQPMPQLDNRYGLYCDAQNSKDKFGSPRLLIPDVEAFKVRFGTKNGTNMQYKDISSLGADDELISIEVGLIMRSTHNLGSDASKNVINNGKSYGIAGNKVTLINQEESPTYIREAFNQVVAIRNSSGG